jgi:arginase
MKNITVLGGFSRNLTFFGILWFKGGQTSEKIKNKNYKVEYVIEDYKLCSETLAKVAHVALYFVWQIQDGLLSYGTGTPVSKGLINEIIAIINKLLNLKKKLFIKFVPRGCRVGNAKGDKWLKTTFEVLEA